jgi:hypothetical protein
MEDISSFQKPILIMNTVFNGNTPVAGKSWVLQENPRVANQRSECR